jgi:hypothetical protein
MQKLTEKEKWKRILWPEHFPTLIRPFYTCFMVWLVLMFPVLVFGTIGLSLWLLWEFVMWLF